MSHWPVSYTHLDVYKRQYQYYPVYNVPESVKKIAAGAFENSKIFNIKADSVLSLIHI